MKSLSFLAALALGAAFIAPSTIATIVFAQAPSKTQAKPADAKADANKKPLSRVLKAMQYTDDGAQRAGKSGKCRKCGRAVYPRSRIVGRGVAGIARFRRDDGLNG